MAQMRQMAIHGVRSHENSQTHIYSTSIKIEKPNDYEPQVWHGTRGKAAGKGGQPPIAGTEGEKQRWASLARQIFDGKGTCKAKLISSYSVSNDLWLVMDSDELLFEAVQTIKQAGKAQNLKGYPAAGANIIKRNI